jgi:hypothetical protein
MKRPRTGIRSTTKQQQQREKIQEETVVENEDATEINFTVPTEGHVIPEEEKVNNVFCFAALSDKNKGTLYTDATGALPVQSIDGNQYYYVKYDYNTNYVNAVPVEDLTDTTIIQTFDTIFEDMEKKGHKPKLNITDNQAVGPLKQYLDKQDCRWQFVEPSNHRVNAAERAIQTWKNHIISGLCSTNKEWPLQLWDQMTQQSIITLNLCRTSRKHPKQSAYHR